MKEKITVLISIAFLIMIFPGTTFSQIEHDIADESIRLLDNVERETTSLYKKSEPFLDALSGSMKRISGYAMLLEQVSEGSTNEKWLKAKIYEQWGSLYDTTLKEFPGLMSELEGLSYEFASAEVQLNELTEVKDNFDLRVKREIKKGIKCREKYKEIRLAIKAKMRNKEDVSIKEKSQLRIFDRCQRRAVSRKNRLQGKKDLAVIMNGHVTYAVNSLEDWEFNYSENINETMLSFIDALSEIDVSVQIEGTPAFNEKIQQIVMISTKMDGLVSQSGKMSNKFLETARHLSKHKGQRIRGMSINEILDEKNFAREEEYFNREFQ
jgi:hypothetical protein